MGKVNVCSVRNCQNKKGKNVELYWLPNGKRNIERRRSWLRMLGKSENLTNAGVCFKHFCPSDFEIGFRHSSKKFLRLKPTAVPHMHLEQTDFAECSSSSCPDETFSESCDSRDSSNNFVDNSIVETNAAIENTAELSEVDLLKQQCQGYREQIEMMTKRILDLENDNKQLKFGIEKCLNPDQLICLKKGLFSGNTWSNETLVKAYKLRLACGSSGYEVIRESGLPLPSQRTLQRKIEHLKFSPGLLNEVLGAFKSKVELMTEAERHCSILLDEMAIASKFDYDPSTGLILGKPTIPSSNGSFEECATHGLVYMLAGTATRWKQVVGYQLTGDSFSAQSVKDDIDNIVREAEFMGLKVDIIVSDMSGQNQAIWKLAGINVTRFSKVNGSCSHPADTFNPQRKLYFSPDSPHVFKHIRDHLTNGHKIVISAKFVQKYVLPTDTIDIQHIRALAEIDAKRDLKLAPFLKESCLKPSHFEKMKVGLALRLLHHDTGAALQYCVQSKLLGEEVLTTAWFCQMMFKWFKLITGRSPSLALHESGPKFQESIVFFREIIELFYELKIGVKQVWKPVQTGVILATSNAIELADYYLNEKKFHYLCLGRFTQDALENLFSTIRFINAVPSPKYFKMALRLISTAQFFRPNKKGSYEIDDAIYLADFLNQKVERIEEENDLENVVLDYAEAFKLGEKDSLYYLAGVIVHQLLKQNFSCAKCIEAMKTKPDDILIAKYKTLLELKAFSNKLIYASKEVFDLFEKAEVHFRCYESSLIQSEAQLSTVIEDFFKYNTSNLPTCHNLAERLIKIYCKNRIYFMLTKINTTKEIDKQRPSRCDSKSLGMRRAVQSMC